MTVTSGPTSGKQFATYDHDSHSWKTWPAIGLWGSIEYSETLPKTGAMSDGQLYELVTSEPHTTANDCSSWSFLPTPTASDWKRNDAPADRRRRSPGITTATVHWPGLVAPPTSCETRTSGGETVPQPS